MAVGRHRREHQHVSSSGAVALKELCKGLDHKSAPWPVAPWQAFKADDRCYPGRVFLQLCCLSLQRVFLDSLYFTHLFLHHGTEEEPRLRSSWGCYSDPTGWPGATLMVQATQLHNVALIWELMLAGANGGKSLLLPCQFTGKLPFHLLPFRDWWPRDGYTCSLLPGSLFS